ncbi:MAG: GspE/PulE family protein [Bacillota bacterium]
MDFSQGKSLLGLRLVESGVITPEQLESALRFQSEDSSQKGLLGDILVRLGYCTEEDVARALAQRDGKKYITLESYRLDDSASSLVSTETARRYGALPIGFSGGKLLVAMKNPSNIIAIDDLRILTGYDIQPVVMPDSELDAAIERTARSSADVEQPAEENSQEETFPALEETNEKPAVQLANQILNESVRAGASDVHIEIQEKSLRVRFRIDGVLHNVMHPPRQLHPSLVSRIKVMANMNIAERRVPQDGRITLRVDGKSVDVRVATLPTAHGEKLTLRLLDRTSRIISLEDSGFSPDMMEKYSNLIRLPYGFILVTGPTGSGKTTTLYATLSVLNSTDRNIITVEDPIEYRLDGLNQIQVNSKAGLTFATGLRSILRNDPDIIMVGEIRDRETARIAVESALTGHLVLSTLHTNDAAGAITRLGDMGIEPFLTASSLVGVVAQRLVRMLCPHCKEPYEYKRRELENVAGFPLEDQEERVTLYRPKGCLRCSKTGYKGRMGIYELLINSESIQRLTLEHRSAREINDAAVAEGMVTMRRDGMIKVKQGFTSLEEMMRVIV